MQTLRKPPVATLLCGLIFLVVGLLIGGCQSARDRYTFSPLPVGIKEEAQADDPDTRRLLPGEEITIRFPEGTNYVTRIQDDGTINLPLIGSVKAGGKTSYDLQVEVYELYVPRFYKHGTIPPPAGQRVYYVAGQVKSPGRQLYIGQTTVTKAIQSAGDFTDFAVRSRVELTRANGQKIEVNCIKAAKDRTLDLAVYPGDKIVVPTHTFWDLFR